MRKLLFATFVRLFKSKIFWIGIAALGGLALWATVARWYDSTVLVEMGYDTLDGLLFIGAVYAPIWVPVFVSLFIGTEYSDGTMRNKLIVGHSKLAVYFANLIVCVSAVLIIHLVYIGIVLGLGLPLIGGFRLTATSTLVTFFFCSLATMVSLTALMLAVAMLIPSKAAGAIASMLLGLALIMVGMTVSSMLQAPEMIEAFVGMDATGEPIFSDPHPNPKYLRGVSRTFFDFLNRFLPGNQLTLIGTSMELPQNVWQLPVYAMLFAAVITLGGTLVFRRKDLK